MVGLLAAWLPLIGVTDAMVGALLGVTRASRGSSPNEAYRPGQPGCFFVLLEDPPIRGRWKNRRNELKRMRENLCLGSIGLPLNRWGERYCWRHLGRCDFLAGMQAIMHDKAVSRQRTELDM